MFTDFLLKLAFYIQPEKFPVVWLDSLCRQTHVTRLKQKKITSELATKHRQTNYHTTLIIFLNET